MMLSITTICHYAECHHAECHYAECHYAECHYAECHYLFIVVLNGFMLSVIMLNVVMLSVNYFWVLHRCHCELTYFACSVGGLPMLLMVGGFDLTSAYCPAYLEIWGLLVVLCFMSMCYTRS